MPTHARTGVTAADRGIGASVTWVELTSVLSANGLLQSDVLPVPGGSSVLTGVMYDSRAVTPGALFVALKGRHADGSGFVRQALERGASAIVSEQTRPADIAAPWIVVSDARLALALLSTAF